MDFDAGINSLENLRLSIHDPIVRFDEDLLGRSELASKIITRLRNDNCPPVIGLYGSWGTGKTSLLNLLMLMLASEDEDTLTAIQIDAWKYETTTNLLVPVIVKLKKKLRNPIFRPIVWHSIVRRISFSTVLSLGDIAWRKIGIDPSHIQDNFDKVAKLDAKDASSILLDWEKMTDEVDQTLGAFQELVQIMLDEAEKQRLVIIIDNLDRCSPESVVAFLESIKNFMSVPRCTWILAIDAGVMANYIKNKYPQAAIDGHSYLDKIIPEQFHLSLSPARDYDKIHNLLFHSIGDNKSLNHIPRTVVESMPEIPHILVPRRLIKSARKFSEFYHHKHLSGISPDTVFVLALLYHGWPDFYERLSFTPKENLRGLIGNFFQESYKIEGECATAPLDKKYTENNSLSFFLRSVLLDSNAVLTDKKIDEIMRCIDGLRNVGLP